MKVKDIHKSTIEQYDFINSKYPKRFPLFGNLCGKHRSIYNDIDTAESIDKSDELYVPDEPGHSTFSMDDSNDFLRKSFENIFPVRYQANKSKVNESASSSLKYYKRKFEYWYVTENYLKWVAPAEETEFLETLTGSDDRKNDNHKLKLLLDAYKSADSDKLKIIILSAIDPKTYTKEQVMNIFDCPRYKVDAAQKWRKVVGPLHEKIFSLEGNWVQDWCKTSHMVVPA